MNKIAPAALATGDYSVQLLGGRPDCTKGKWRVLVQVHGHLVSREVCHDETPWSPYQDDGNPTGRHEDEVIWPTWPATLQEEKDASATPLADLQKHWDQATARLRDSAKWMAAVIGAALAAVIPTAPLTNLSRHITTVPAVLGAAGLVLVGMTMLLVLRVMQPQSVTYDEIQNAEPSGSIRDRLQGLTSRRARNSRTFGNPLYKWKDDLQKHPDLYLPCGVNSPFMLRQLMVVEEVTLMALARAEEQAEPDTVGKQLREARAARAARLHELRAAAASVVTIGVYYQVRARSTSATYWGVAFSLLGVMAIIAAISLPVK